MQEETCHCASVVVPSVSFAVADAHNEHSSSWTGQRFSYCECACGRANKPSMRGPPAISGSIAFQSLKVIIVEQGSRERTCYDFHGTINSTCSGKWVGVRILVSASRCYDLPHSVSNLCMYVSYKHSDFNSIFIRCVINDHYVDTESVYLTVGKLV